MSKTNLYVYGASTQRGRILDVNGVILVDNKPVNTIYYNKIGNIDEVVLAYELVNYIEVPIADELEQKKFYMKINDTANLITDEEYQLFDERKLTSEQLLELKLDRIDLNFFTKEDQQAAHIYSLMTSNLSYDKKVIKTNVSNEEFAIINEANLSGISAQITYERYYPYGDTLKSILGSLSLIHKENKSEYLENGYELTDLVGISYLEKEYENYLKGEKAIYKINENGSLKLIKEEQKGSDIYLSIDINVQLELDKIVKEELEESLTKPNTDYFSDTFAAISDPLNGQILAISGYRIIDNKKEISYEEITSDILQSSYTTGSVVKGATIAVGYNNDLITHDKKIYDSCVKLEFVPEKCSWEPLGYIDDITALKTSSNYYQYLLAINLTGKNYTYNMKLNSTEKEFEIYRQTLSEYGFGEKTGIDLPLESTGTKGEIIADDLLLNLSIGQYDTYTLLQLLQYINTIASGKRYELSLLNKVYNDNELLYIKNNEILNDLTITEENLNRVREGLNQVLVNGTGAGYIDSKLDPVGKTGTSESFLDINNDNIVDVKTISLTFAGYFPRENPKYSIAIISPHIAYKEEDDDYIYRITRYISNEITTFLFDNY